MPLADIYHHPMSNLIDEIWNNQNYDAIARTFHEDAIYYSGGPSELGGTTMTGIADFRENFVRHTLAAFPDLMHTIEDLFSSGDRQGSEI